MRKKIVAGYLALTAGFFWAGTPGYSQGVDTIVEVPTTARTSPVVQVPTTAQPADDSGPGVTVGGEYKSTKNVVEEQEKPVFWNWAADVGYVSEYNFRGTNLTPHSGAVFGDAEVTKWNFTLGMFAIGQTGIAHANAWSMGESGGGGTATAFPGAII